VLDFKEAKFCRLNGQFIETRMVAGRVGCQGELFHKDIHTVCGYLKKRLPIRHLAFAAGSMAA